MSNNHPSDDKNCGALALSGASGDCGNACQSELTSAFENAAIGMAVISPDSRTLRVNQAFAQMLGYSLTEMLARSMHDMTHPEDAGHDLEQRDLCLAGKQDGC